MSAGARPKTIPASERNGQREKQDASVEGHFAGARERAGQNVDGGFGSEESKDKTQRPAQPSQKCAFCEKLADDASATGAERRADGEFAGSRHGARQKKAGDVGARDEQQEADRGQQHDQEGLHIADDVFLHGIKRDAHVFVRFRIRNGEMVGDGVHVGAGLLEGDAGFEAADGVGAFVDATIAERGLVPLSDGRVEVAIDAVE